MQPISTAALAARSATPKAPKPTTDAAAARRAAEEFEAVFVGQMLSHMFEGVGTDPLFGGGQSEKIYRSMLQDEYGKAIAKAGGIGVADAVMREILILQEGGRP